MKKVNEIEVKKGKVTVPYSKTEEYYRFIELLRRDLGLDIVERGDNILVKSGETYYDGLIFKKPYPLVLTAIWLFNHARKADITTGNIVMDYDSNGYAMVKALAEKIAEKTGLNIRLDGYSMKDALVPMHGYPL